MPDPNPDTQNAPANHDAATLRPGDKVEAYTVKRQIGSGGSSIVFKAVDELLGKEVAIKQFLFSKAEDDAGLREKIMTEARLHQKAAQTDTDRLVQVVDVVDSPHGLLLISEYINGPSLEQILAQNPLPMELKQALGIIAAAAQALDAIHGQGIVHLDLKPANILMPRTGGLKISDFGLATERTDHSQPTAGTFRYMAPELLKHEKVDGRADLYALGMMAYEMLAGRENFDQAFKLILRDQRNQAMRWVKWHTNPRAKAPPLTELVPAIPAQISALVERLMDKDPNRRVGTAKQLLKAIKRHFAGKDITHTSEDTGPSESLPPQTTTPGDTAVLPTRSRALKFGIIAAVVVVLAGAAVGIYLFNQSRQAHRETVAQAREIMDQATAAYREGRLEEALQKYDQVTQNDAYRKAFGQHAKAGALLAQGRIDAAQGRYDEAIRAFTQASELGDQYRQKADLLIPETRQTQAFAQTVARIEGYIDEHNFGEARKLLDEWRDLTATDEEQQTLRSLGAKLEDQLARWRVQELIREANALTGTGKRAEAIELLKTGPQKSEVTELLARLEARQTADQAVALADAALKQSDPEEAIKQYERAVQAMPDDQALRNKLTDLRSDWLTEEGLRMLAQGNTVGADQMLTEALGFRPDNQRAREALARIASSGRRDAFIEAGDTAAERREYVTAETQYKNALELGVDDELTAKMTAVRIQILLEQSREALQDGRIDEANELVNQAQQLGSDNPDVAAVLREVGVRGEYIRHLTAGDAARARSSFGEAKRHYLRAKEAMDTPQVRARLDDTEFDHLLAQARDFIAAKEYTSAKAQLQIAASIRTTDEVRALFDQVNAAEAGASPSNP
jgi:serine/threonine protein kinase